MPFGGLLTAGIVVGAGSSVVGGLIQSNAAGNAAQAQQQAAQQALQAQITARANAISQMQQISAASPGEIQAINQILSSKQSALTASLQSLAQQQAQLNAMDPQVKAAGQDLYNLLSGQNSSILAPLQQQLTRQRQELVNNLSSQLGPGFMTSSAGINALTQFDEQSAMTMQNAQLSAISQATATYGSVAGMQNQGQNAVSQQTGEAYGRSMLADQSVLQAQQFITNRQTNAVGQAMMATPIGYTGPVQYAGGGSVGQMGLGQTIAGAGQGFAGGVSMLGAASMYANNPFASSGAGTPLSQQIANTQLPSMSTLPAFGSPASYGAIPGYGLAGFGTSANTFGSNFH